VNLILAKQSRLRRERGKVNSVLVCKCRSNMSTPLPALTLLHA